SWRRVISDRASGVTLTASRATRAKDREEARTRASDTPEIPHNGAKTARDGTSAIHEKTSARDPVPGRPRPLNPSVKTRRNDWHKAAINRIFVGPTAV